MQKPNYRIYDRTGSGVTNDIYAASLEEAIQAGRDWIEEGDWSPDSDSPESGVIAVCRTFTLECEVGPIIYRPAEPNACTSFWDLWQPEWDAEKKLWFVDVSDQDEEEREKIAEFLAEQNGGKWEYDELNERCVWTSLPADWAEEIDDDATEQAEKHDCSGTYTDTKPECPMAKADDGLDDEADEEGHVWRQPHKVVGGIESNPGVWSLGGTRFRSLSVCRRCGCYCEHETPGSQQNPDEPDETYTYKERDEKSTEWLIRVHEEDDWIPGWLAEYLDVPPTTRMSEEEAISWVRHHSEYDDQELDEEELDHAFGAILGGRPDPEATIFEKWSELCSYVD